MPKIRVHEKALAHLSHGLYRSPASAVRELVSNAWDANATYVKIDTNYPDFYQLTIEDDGKGFSRDEFKRLMEGGIGNSEKRPADVSLIHDRPIIGRLGIGMLGIAQVCHGFTVISRPKVGKPFRARVQLHDSLRRRLDTNDPVVVKQRDLEVGTYKFETFKESDLGHTGTLIIADDLYPAFIDAFQQTLPEDERRLPSFNWLENVSQLERVASVQELGHYWRLLWELSVSCPLPYVSEDVVPDGMIRSDHHRLLSYGFRVTVDQVELRKPVLLAGSKHGYTTTRIDFAEKVYDTEVKFHGYLCVQEGRQLKPDEVRGVLVRVKNVGIGYYDASMLDYQSNEGPRSRWLTGEIYVDSGLEDALNVDRDGFNRFHPEFRSMQDEVHRRLRETFRRVYKKIDERSRSKEARADVDRASGLQDLLTEASRKSVQIRRVDTADDAGARVSTNRVVVTLPTASALKKGKHQALLGAILAIYDVSREEPSEAARRGRFADMLRELLSRW